MTNPHVKSHEELASLGLSVLRSPSPEQDAVVLAGLQALRFAKPASRRLKAAWTPAARAGIPLSRATADGGARALAPEGLPRRRGNPIRRPS